MVGAFHEDEDVVRTIKVGAFSQSDEELRVVGVWALIGHAE